MLEKPGVIAIVGPTASGKTALGVRLATALGGEVISADSMQIYNSMPIASAAPTEEEMCGIRHRLIGICDPTERFSVADYVARASLEIEDVIAHKKRPIIVGGTGLYIDSLISGVSFKDEDIGSVREELEREADREGTEHMLAALRKIDPKTAEKYHPNDRKRILRALEIYRIHGKPKSELDAESKIGGDRYDSIRIGITYRDRELLYERINRRVDIMLENGLLKEAEKAFDSNVGGTAVQAIGHKEFFPYFKGEIPLETAVERLKTETRRYAKRQLTWFRRNENCNWIYADETPNVFEEAMKILEI